MSGRSSVVVIVLSIAVAISATAQNSCRGNFSGSVLSDSGEALQGATVTLKPGLLGLACDKEGYFHFDNLCNGRYEVTVQYLGYRTRVIEIAFAGSLSMKISLEPDLKKLDEVVIEGKHEHAENAQNYAVLSGKDLAESAGKPLGAALQEVPGVNTIQTGPGIFKPVIHGVHSQRVLILNHGIRQEGQQWGAEHAPEIDPFVASELIVIKDASAIKYGSDALGGVIIVNPAPLPEQGGLGGSLNTAYQTNGRAAVISGVLEGGLKNREGWGWRIQGTGKRAGDHRTPDYLLANTGISELDFSSALGYHADKWGAEVFFSHFQTELGILKGTAVATEADLVDAMERDVPLYTTNEFTYDISPPYQQAAHNLLKLNGHLQTEKGEWHFQYGFQENARKEFDLRGPGVSSYTPAINLRLTTHTTELEWETGTDMRKLCFGLNTMIQDNENIPGTQRIPFVPNFTSVSGGPFAVATIVKDKFKWDAGARVDYRRYQVAGRDYRNELYHSTLNFANVSATAGATYDLRANQSISLSASTAWRPPHVTELYSFGTHQSAASKEYGLLLNDSTNEVMSTDDVPVRVEEAAKLVATHRYTTSQFQLETTAYANFIFNYIYLRPAGITQDLRGAGIYFRYTQTDALFMGVDLAVTWLPAPQWKITPKVSYLHASDYRNKDYLVFIPSSRGELGIRYTPRLSKPGEVYLESVLKYVARQNRAPRVITPRELSEGVDPSEGDGSNFDFMKPPDAYMLWNLAAGYSVHTGKGKCDFRIASENTLNTVYREYTNRYKYFADDIGRNVFVSIKYIF